MGRKKNVPNPEVERLLRFVMAMDHPLFFQDVAQLLLYRQEQLDNGVEMGDNGTLFEEDAAIEWDESRQTFVFYGLYFAAMVICYKYDLKWPDDYETLKSLMRAQDSEAVTGILLPRDCPPPHYWKIFRMAQRGLGIVRPDEIKDTRRTTPHGKKDLTPEEGLTFTALAEMFDCDERTIHTAIKKCRSYLAGGDNARRVVELAGLDPFNLREHWKAVARLEEPEK